ncbi:hypothetical protein STRNTR1_3487 [Stenotrophomonas maltophilia]|nr:hypothetical protein STRNTR1_3487 [Stenotrophomonas maltophilia]
MAQGVEEGEHPPIIAAHAACWGQVPFPQEKGSDPDGTPRAQKRRPCFQGRLQSRHDCCVAV